MMKIKMKPRHVGVFFKRRYIDQNDSLNVSNTAKCLGVSRQHLHKLINGEAPCTAEMSARLAKATDTNAAFWINMQANYDSWYAEEKMESLNVKNLNDVAA